MSKFEAQTNQFLQSPLASQQLRGTVHGTNDYVSAFEGGQNNDTVFQSFYDVEAPITNQDESPDFNELQITTNKNENPSLEFNIPSKSQFPTVKNVNGTMGSLDLDTLNPIVSV